MYKGLMAKSPFGLLRTWFQHNKVTCTAQNKDDTFFFLFHEPVFESHDAIATVHTNIKWNALSTESMNVV